MGRSRRGSGSVFQRTYRDAKGKNRKTANWYIEFVAGNRTMREATEFTNRTEAAEFLKKRISDALGGKIVLSRNVTYDDLRDLIITDYTNIQGVLTARLLVTPAVHDSGTDGDRLLTAEEVAHLLGVTKRWVQRRARRLPFARRISDHAIRYSQSGLKRWMSNRKVSAA